MRLASVILIASMELCCLGSAAGSAEPRTFRVPHTLSQAVRPFARGERASRRRFAPSCAGYPHGGYAFDDSLTFITNYSTTEEFGQGNVAASDESGAFEGFDNIVCDEEAVIAGGDTNTIDGGGTNTENGNAFDSFIGGGDGNTITEYRAFIGGGDENEVSASDGFIGSGDNNVVSASESFAGSGSGNVVNGMTSFLGAGTSNTIKAASAFIGAGTSNANSGGSYGSIVGGNHNAISGEYASVIGGFGNAANGAYAIVAGGDADTAAGTLTFAAGYHADAAHNGSFVWSDYTSGSTTLKDSANNQFVVRASGGTYVYSNEAATAGVSLAAGSGSWASLSDRNAKTDVRPLDDASVLAKVTTLPVSTWRYKSERGVRHAGPMAQDFYTAFGVGEDDRHITSIDEDGVALSAIKALSRQMKVLRRENAALSARVIALEKAR